MAVALCDYSRFKAKVSPHAFIETGSYAYGEIRDRSFEQQRYRASGLNLVTAAIVLWNTVYLERATQGLVEAGKPVDGELLQYLSPLGWEHINLTGNYVWRQSRRLEDGKFRPLRLPGKP